MQRKNILFPYLREQLFHAYLREESQSLVTLVCTKYSTRRLRAKVSVFIAQISNQEKYDASVPYIAMVHFDRFIATNPLPTFGNKDVYYRANVLAISCLCLASKMTSKPVQEKTILQSMRGLGINKNHVSKVEKLVQRAVWWTRHFVHALCFVPNFLSIVAEPGLNIKSDVIMMIIQSASDIEVTRFMPSVIAASAVLIIRSTSISTERFTEYLLKFTSEDVSLRRRDIDACADAMVHFRNRARFPLSLERRTREGEGSSSTAQAAPVSSSSDAVHRPGQLPTEDEPEIKDTTANEPEMEGVPTPSPGTLIIREGPEREDVTQRPGKETIKDAPGMDDVPRQRPGKAIMKGEAVQEDVPTEGTNDEFAIEEKDLMGIELRWMVDDNENQRLDELLFPRAEDKTKAFIKKLNCCKKTD